MTESTAGRSRPTLGRPITVRDPADDCVAHEVLHVVKHLATITRDPTIADVFFETRAGNRRVVHVARKLSVLPAGTRVDQLKGGITLMQYSSKR